ncbi:MAG: glycosyltransferase [Ignavibacteriaceae bacterium]
MYKVSIIMPTFNRANWIGSAIKSIQKQTFEDWELLIIDNQSKDNTKAIVEDFSSGDNRIKYFNVKKSSHQGLSDYLNYGLKIAVGEYIARLDDDDEWYDQDKLLEQVRFLDKNPDYVITGGGAIMVDGEKKELYRFFKRESDTEIRNNALYACPFIHITVLYRKKIAVECGGYRNLRFGEDWELWLRLGKMGKFYNFRKYFCLYTNAGQNFSVNSQRHLTSTVLEFIKEYRNYYPHYSKAYILNFMQYLYSFSPPFIKNKTQNFLFYVKRNYF